MNRLDFKLAILLVLTAAVCRQAHAQQDPQFSQNMFNLMAVNPGYAGSQGLLSATLINRQQWMGFEGNPKTTLGSVHAPIKPFGISSGVGLVFMDDRLGFEKNMTIMGNYAYRLDLGPGTLGIGINLGLLSKSLNGKWVIPDSDLVVGYIDTEYAHYLEHGVGGDVVDNRAV